MEGLKLPQLTHFFHSSKSLFIEYYYSFCLKLPVHAYTIFIKSAFIHLINPTKVILSQRIGIYKAVIKNHKLPHLYDLERDN